MPEAIFGERFIGHREPAWHRVGQVVDTEMKASEAIVAAGLDYAVETQPLLLPNGTESGHSAVVRPATEDDPEDAVFGVAKNYELVHVTDVAPALDQLPWPVNAAGALREGRDVFIVYDLGTKSIVTEDYRMHLAIVHPYSPGNSWKAMLTPVRIVCENTLVLGTKEAISKIHVSHHPGARARIDTAMMIAQAAAMEDVAMNRLQLLADMPRLSDADVDNVLSKTYPYARKPKELMLDNLDVDTEAIEKKYEAQSRHVRKLKDLTLEVYDVFNQEHKDFAATPYALYQAVVEAADYRKGSRQTPRKQAETALVGNRAVEKQRAINALFEME